MALTPDQVPDFVEATLKEFKRKQWTDISLPLQHYICGAIVLLGVGVGLRGYDGRQGWTYSKRIVSGGG